MFRLPSYGQTQYIPWTRLGVECGANGTGTVDDNVDLFGLLDSMLHWDGISAGNSGNGC